MSWMVWSLVLLLLLALAALGLRSYGAERWDTATQALAHRLQAAREPMAVPLRYDARELEGLPVPVQRYFRAVLTEGQPIITTTSVELVGHFNLSAAGEQWKPFTSRQWVVARRPGFLWDAQVALLPGVPVRVVDRYIAGEGGLRAAVLGLFTVGQVQGGGEIARGELMRWFAEAAWYPTALLPSQGVQWEAFDDRSAYATIVDGPITLRLLFEFDEAGLMVAARAAARGAMVGQDMVMLPWEGRWSGRLVRDGMVVPLTGEAAWFPPQGRKPYFRGTVTALTYGFAC